IVGVGLMAFFTGCGNGGTSSTPPDAAHYMIDAGCQALPDGGPPGAPSGDINGTWALLEVTAADVMSINDVQIAINIYLDTITQTGTAITETEKLCHLQIDDESGLASTRVLPAFATT